MEKEIRDLIDKLNYYTKKYDEGHPEISDQEWDWMYFQLQKMEFDSGIYYPDSPTQSVNYQVVNQLNKVEHNHPMLSLDKTKDLDAIKAFIGKKDYIAMAKMDGLTCSLRYLGGKLVSAETRGNGYIGEDILHNALHVKSIPNKINYVDELILDGEIICTDKDFKEFQDEYKNSRNFASGSIRLLDSEQSAARHLTFVVWDVIKGLDWCKSLSEKLFQLDDLFACFTVVPYAHTADIDLDIKSIVANVDRLGYPIDGIVFKYDNCLDYINAGKTDHHFKGGMAYKFYDEEYETRLLNIEWSMGRTGALTPVAIFEPIEIDGTEVSRASLSNLSVMEDTLGKPYINEKLWVTKRNMIIPKVERAEKLDYNEDDEIKIPQICPECSKPTTVINNDGVKVLFCGNPQCQGKFINRLDHFCGKAGLDIKGLSMATLEKLINWGWISSFVDIYKLENKSNIWKTKAGFGEKSVERILRAIQDSKNTTLDAVIAAAGIPLIGRAVAKELCKYIKSSEEFREKVDNRFDFTQYDGFGDIMSASILAFDYTELDEVVSYALNIQQKATEEESNSLKGLVFCITGKVHTVKNRDELKGLIESAGGKVVGSVSKNVNYLINNDNTSTSSKNIAAKNLNIPVITEDELRLMI